MAWLLRNFFQSEVSIHATCKNLTCCKTGLIRGWLKVQHRYSACFTAIVAKQVARFCCPFYPSVNVTSVNNTGSKSSLSFPIRFLYHNGTGHWSSTGANRQHGSISDPLYKRHVLPWILRIGISNNDHDLHCNRTRMALRDQQYLV